MGFPLLDSSLRDFIFFPLTVITICVSLLMKYLSSIMGKDKKQESPSATKSLDTFSYEHEIISKDTDLKIQNAIDRANRLKENFMFLSEQGFKKRRAFFNEYFSRNFEEKQADLMNIIKNFIN